MSSEVLGTYHLLGHSHIDAVWLWNKDETVKVCADTFRKVLDLMDRHPGLKYCQSSAQYYEWIEERYPKLFRRIRAKVKQGLWEVVGGSWVEFDCNIPSGESLVRQMLYGKKYFLEKFGIDVEICWLPDSFGFSSSLPQILSGAGVKYFLTQKLNWNDTTRFPFNVFSWKSSDGSRVLTHLLPGSYSEELSNFEEVSIQMNILRRRHDIEDLLILFGYGDHGGGWSTEHVKNALKFVREKMKGEKVRFSTAAEYFRILESHIESHEIPVVNGELYLQFHRGTYTTQATMKLLNRKAEQSLESSEKFATLAVPLGFRYPKKELKEAWKILLFNQFHDAICGSSINEVYDEAGKEFVKLFRKTSRIMKGSISVLSSNTDTRGNGISLMVYNPLSWARDCLVEVDLKKVGKGSDFAVRDPSGITVATQAVDDGKRLLFVGREIPSMGFKEFKVVPAKNRTPMHTDLEAKEEKGSLTLENEYIRLSFYKSSGLVHGIPDKITKRGLLSPKGKISIQIFHDQPVEGRKALDSGHDSVLFDAWEVYAYDQHGGPRYSEPVRVGEVTVLEEGPVRASVCSTFKYAQKGRRDSKIKQTVSLLSGIPVIYMELQIDWNARHRLAKVAIPTSVKSEYETCEIPYGSIQRRSYLSPNASLEERAKYEVPGQKWVDKTATDGSYGLSVLNDSKYGFDATNDSIRITLLRSPSFPPPWPVMTREDWTKVKEPTDQGRHKVVIGLYPHKGDWRDSLTTRKSYEFNCPAIVHFEPNHNGELPKSHSFVQVNSSNVIITALKESEDSTQKIMRLYETNGRETKAKINLFKRFSKAWETDLMENPLKEVSIRRGKLRVRVAPNKIKTVMLS